MTERRWGVGDTIGPLRSRRILFYVYQQIAYIIITPLFACIIQSKFLNPGSGYKGYERRGLLAKGDPDRSHDFFVPVRTQIFGEIMFFFRTMPSAWLAFYRLLVNTLTMRSSKARGNKLPTLSFRTDLNKHQL